MSRASRVQIACVALLSTVHEVYRVDSASLVDRLVGRNSPIIPVADSVLMFLSVDVVASDTMILFRSQPILAQTLPGSFCRLLGGARVTSTGAVSYFARRRVRTAECGRSRDPDVNLPLDLPDMVLDLLALDNLVAVFEGFGFSEGVVFDDLVSARIPLPVAGFSAAFGDHARGRQYHGLVDRFEHVVHGQSGDRRTGHGLHFHAGLALARYRRGDDDSSVQILCEAQCLTREGVWEHVPDKGLQVDRRASYAQAGMCQWDQVGRFLRPLDAGDSSDSKGVTFPEPCCKQRTIGQDMGEE